MHIVEQERLPLLELMSSSDIYWDSCCLIVCVLCNVSWISTFSFFFLFFYYCIFRPSILDSDYPFGIFKLSQQSVGLTLNVCYRQLFRRVGIIVPLSTVALFRCSCLYFILFLYLNTVTVTTGAFEP